MSAINKSSTSIGHTYAMENSIREDNQLWDLFTKEEEYSFSCLDKYKRFPYSSSRYKNPLDPTVSKYLSEKGFGIDYPDEYKFALCLTHDIDNIFVPKSHIARSLFCLHDSWKTSNFIIKSLIKKTSPYKNLADIITLEKRYNAKSTFFFLADGKDPRRFRYNLSDLSDVIPALLDNDCDIGLHGGFCSYNNLDQIKLQKYKLEKVLNKDIIGYRGHYLRFSTPITWELLKEAGFKYDSTFGYPDMIGFRNGICYPFHPFDLNTNNFLNILELPLNLMDSTLLDYMKKTPENSWPYIKQLIDSTELYGGICTILWHNDTFFNPYKKKWRDLYAKILEYASKKNAWMTSANEIYFWWNKNI